MFKVIHKGKENEFAVMNGINKKSRLYVPRKGNGLLASYTIIDAVTIGKSKDHYMTFALLEHEELGEEDMIIVRLPNNGKLMMVIREDHSEWGTSESAVAYLIPVSRIVVDECYNGFDDLEDAGWNLWDENENCLPDVQFWTEEEINDK